MKRNSTGYRLGIYWTRLSVNKGFCMVYDSDNVGGLNSTHVH